MEKKDYKVEAVPTPDGGMTYVSKDDLVPRARASFWEPLGFFCIGVVIGAVAVLTVGRVL